jgi:hypothetical protein
MGNNEGAYQCYLHTVTNNFTDHSVSDDSVSDHVSDSPFTDIITNIGTVMYTTPRVVCRSYG